MRVYGNRHLTWKGHRLCCGNRKLVEIVQDDRYPTMWRVKRPDGSLTDMVNITRARDAARGLALKVLNREETLQVALPMA